MIDRLVSLGSVIVDLVLAVPALPVRGGDVLATQRGIAAGGAFNVISAAARLGLTCVYAGPHGTGTFGDLVRRALAQEGVSVAQPANRELDTGWTAALVEPDGERTFVTVTGADAIVDEDSLRAILYGPRDAIYVSGYDLAYPGAGAAVAQHVARLDPALFVAFDPGPLAAQIEPGLIAAVLARARMVSLNRRELAALGGIESLQSRLPRGATVIARDGPRGASLHAVGAEPLPVPAYRIEAVVDTSGAGDVHVGATLAGLARGMTWAEAVLLANRAAAFAVARHGPAAGPTGAELEAFLADGI